MENITLGLAQRQREKKVDWNNKLWGLTKNAITMIATKANWRNDINGRVAYQLTRMVNIENSGGG